MGARWVRGRAGTSLAMSVHAACGGGDVYHILNNEMPLPYWRFLRMAACLAAIPGKRGRLPS
eukprot:9935842-Prorocentrum_lima.AAC.1